MESRIEWRLRLASPPRDVFAALATDEGRERFWAERSLTEEDEVSLWFPDGTTCRGRILAEDPDRRFSMDYMGGPVEITLTPSGSGTDLLLAQRGLAKEDAEANRAGWVSVLLCLKAYVDFGIDLRNHDPERTWARAYVDN